MYQFLEKRHKDHYKVYNLCSEKNRQYDAVKFNDNVACYPFEDHHPPPFELIEEFCKDVKAYLDRDSKNVAAIHCKAGKGRTGTMVIAYLLYSRAYSDPEHAKAYYAAMRTYNRKGLTIPSQIRYVDYFFASLTDRALVAASSPPTLILTSVKMAPPPFIDKFELLRFTVHCNRVLVYDHESVIPVDEDMIRRAKSASMAKINAMDDASTKQPKNSACPACNKSHAYKDSVWVVCSICGRETCTDCTKKVAVHLPTSVVPRFACSECVSKTENAEEVARLIEEQERQFQNRMAERAVKSPPDDEGFFIELKPEKPIAVRGDVKVSIIHRGPKPLVHFWINTRFHNSFPLVFGKQQVDGSDKDPKCKKFPCDFRLVVNLRAAEAGDSVLVPNESVSPTADKKKSVTTPSGFVVEPNGSVVFNKANGTGSYSPSVAASLLNGALSIINNHAIQAEEDGGHVFSVDSAAAVVTDLDYGALIGRLGSLNLVDLSQSSKEEAIAFWLNVYHLLLTLSLIECFPYTPKDRVKNGRNCVLHVCGEKISLANIEYGILRSAHAAPQLPQSVSGNLPKKHLVYGDLLANTEFSRLITFGISYICPGSPSLRVYEPATLKEQLEENGGQFLMAWGIRVNPKKPVVSLSSYLEWFQTEEEANGNVQLAVTSWMRLCGSKFDNSLSGRLQKEETYKFKFEDNVMLDEVVFFFSGASMAAHQEGLHFSSPRKASNKSADNDNNAKGKEDKE